MTISSQNTRKKEREQETIFTGKITESKTTQHKTKQQDSKQMAESVPI